LFGIKIGVSAPYSIIYTTVLFEEGSIRTIGQRGSNALIELELRGRYTSAHVLLRMSLDRLLCLARITERCIIGAIA